MSQDRDIGGLKTDQNFEEINQKLQECFGNILGKMGELIKKLRLFNNKKFRILVQKSVQSVISEMLE